MLEFIGGLFIFGIIGGWIYLIRDASSHKKSSTKSNENLNNGCVIVFIILFIIGGIVYYIDFFSN
jgi:prolipoprotein diacylglyceryltransferase